jgi:hypothetical protein
LVTDDLLAKGLVAGLDVRPFAAHETVLLQFLFFTLSMNAWVSSLWMMSTGNPTRVQCDNCSTAAANSFCHLPLSWIPAFS